MDLLFVFDGCEVAQRAVEPLAVVEDLDELDDGPADLGDRGPRLPVDELFLEGREPAFTNGVVPTLAGATETLGRLVGLEQGGEVTRGVLRSPIRVNPNSA